MALYEGRHLMVDGRVPPPHGLNDPGIGAQLLESIVEAIDMTMILPPITVKFPHAVCELDRVVKALEQEGLAGSDTCRTIRDSLRHRKLQSYGYSTFVMIAESHLTLHTFPEWDFFTFDCYSCKNFETEPVARLLQKTFPGMVADIQSAARRMPNAPWDIVTGHTGTNGGDGHSVIAF